MIRFEGTYFDGKSSKAHPADITFDGSQLLIRGTTESLKLTILISECLILPPLGKYHRSIRLPDGAQIDTRDFSAVESMEEYTGANRVIRLVHFLESHTRITVGCIALLLLAIWSFVMFGIPLLADRVARSVPDELVESMSQRAVNELDDAFFEPSELEEIQIDSIREIFRQLPEEIGTDFDYRLEFRKGAIFGPNAIAFPSGTILMTDELISLSDNEYELIGILAHEITHVESRHGLRQILQDAGVFLLISALVGDIASVSSIAATLPTLLVESGYSRKFEREADEAVVRYFVRKGWSIQPYLDILWRISDDPNRLETLSWFSTHPAVEERVRYMTALKRELSGSQ